mgnify:CR=1 FL=1
MFKHSRPQTSKNKKTKSLSVTSILLLISLLIINHSILQAQLDGNTGGGVLGPSPLQGLDGNSQLRDVNWGVLPSRQNQTDIWGRNVSNSNRTQQQSRSRTQARDINGNPVLTDRNGNVLYDAQGQAIIDSTALNGGGVYDPSLDPPSITDPPPDPNDVPLDGGVTILLMLATGMGYKNRKLLPV